VEKFIENIRLTMNAHAIGHFQLENAVNHQAKLNEIIGKYNGSGSGLPHTPQHNAITIQDLVRKMHQGSGLKMI
jgi:hypothetical protein